MGNRASILMIYTGGTIGMVSNPESGMLEPFEFDHLYRQVPELKSFDIDLTVHSFDHPLDSSDMHPDVWAKLAEEIYDNYNDYDGFVILHGSDTMAFTASALSFMLQGLNKPVVLTGSQLPVGVIRTDGKENLITSIEIAAAKNEDGQPIIREVCIYFEYQLLRGNRTTKISASHFDAFASPNYPILAEAGVEIDYNAQYLMPLTGEALKLKTSLDNRIALIKLFPGMRADFLKSITTNQSIRGVVLETFGSGNAPTAPWFLSMVNDWIDEGKSVVNITQCYKGDVVLGKYLNSSAFKEMGVISGRDLTTEGAVTKMMYALGQSESHDEVASIMGKNLVGEMR